MPKSLIYLAILQCIVGCAGVKHCRVLELNGTSGALTVGVRVVDPRTGEGYAGTLTKDGTQSEPLGDKPQPALVLPTDTRVTVDAVDVAESS